jgi:hypothetical protein
MVIRFILDTNESQDRYYSCFELNFIQKYCFIHTFIKAIIINFIIKSLIFNHV